MQYHWDLVSFSFCSIPTYFRLACYVGSLSSLSLPQGYFSTCAMPMVVFGWMNSCSLVLDNGIARTMSFQTS
ncbi:uncharacterized protein BDW43DRAFT_11825 [Aspergillus alliaceus]|uniref:uncharacterized protein n=1 Tax=Petromyces alliaceus TaxID=209559 RepID=UPI0012A58E38|nr:uncharacterized protein BDW43DRAFT_11825 [Aspergillus alliaceus]KAB8239783.1 hypothetical protein BDW43DRAFT_11825 [Aspergillus alliaceus]